MGGAVIDKSMGSFVPARTVGIFGIFVLCIGTLISSVVRQAFELVLVSVSVSGHQGRRAAWSDLGGRFLAGRGSFSFLSPLL